MKVTLTAQVEAYVAGMKSARDAADKRAAEKDDEA